MTYGMNASIGIGFQDSFGTANVDSLFWVPFLSESLGVEQPPIMSEELRGVYDEGVHYAGPITTGGDISVEPDAISLGQLIKAICGPPTTTKNESAEVYTHVFKPRQSDFGALAANDPMTIHKTLGDPAGCSTNFIDMVGTEIEIGITQSELLSVRLAVVGGRTVQLAPISPSYPEGKQWTWNQTSYSLAGAAIPEVTQATIKVTENISVGHTLNGERNPSRAKREGFRSITVDGTMKFDSAVEYQNFLDNVEQALVITFTGSHEISSGHNDVLEIDISQFRYGEFKPVAGGPGEIEVGFSAKGVYNVSSGTGIQFTLTNTQTSYA